MGKTFCEYLSSETTCSSFLGGICGWEGDEEGCRFESDSYMTTQAEAHPDSELATMLAKKNTCTSDNYADEDECLGESDKHCDWGYEYNYVYENDER